jgi:K+-sensing histidine kinase KdpD
MTGYMLANAQKKVLANELDAAGAPSTDVQPASSVGRSLTAGARLQQLLAKGLMVGSDQEGGTRHLKAALLVTAITLLGALLDLRVAPTNLAMLYLLGVVAISYRLGFGPALTYSALSTLTFDFFFIPPYESFAFTDFWYFLTALTFMGIALFISILTTTVRQYAVAAARRETQTATLYALMQALASARGPSEIIQAASAHFKAVLGLDIAVLLASEAGSLSPQMEPNAFRVDDSLRAAAEGVFASARSGAIHREGAFLPLRAGEDAIGIMVFPPTQFLSQLHEHEDVLVNAMAGQVALAIKRSLLEEKAREADREQQRVQRAKAEAIATLAGGLAHDLNNLLTGVLGNASLVADSLPLYHPSRSLLTELNRAGERAAHIVAQVLSYAGKGRLFDELIDLSALVDGFVKGLPPIPANIELSVRLGDHLPRLQGDRNQLLQLIGNLYLNAVDAIDEASGRIHISTYCRDGRRQADVSSGSSPVCQCVCLSVTDTGCGIEESIRPRIFDPFFTTKFVGRGLGLSAAEGIMRAHNGNIRVASEPGKGSTFTCLFAAGPTEASKRV